jgi:dynein heavy chain
MLKRQSNLLSIQFLSKQYYKKGLQFFINFNDTSVPVSNDFKLYMLTKLTNPNYLPEAFIKLNIINCSVTESGLEEQLLGEIVLNECPQLEEQRDSLIRQIAEDKKQLLDIQAKILKLINEVQGNLLDDEELIVSLESSKLTSEAVNQRMKDSEITNENINQTRNVYRPLAFLGSLSFFVISSMVNVNYMYQFSLEYLLDFSKSRWQSINSNKIIQKPEFSSSKKNCSS